VENTNGPNFNKWLNQNILAIDYGTKNTGLASFCPGRDPFPTPYGRIIYQNKPQLILEIKKVIDDNSIDLVVLGVPFLLDGKETEMTRRIKNFAVSLAAEIQPTPLETQDETLSSFEAEERMKNSPQYNFKIDLKHLDAVAATIILEDFMKK